MIHLLMKETIEGGISIEAAYAHQESAHLQAEVESLVPDETEEWYATSLQVDYFDNEEGIDFIAGLPGFQGGEIVHLVVELDNPVLIGVLPFAAFTNLEEASALAERQNLLNLDYTGKFSVRTMPVSHSSPSILS